MNTMHPLELLIDAAIIIAAVLFLLWLAALFLGTKDDAAAGILLGPETLSLDDVSGRAALRAASGARAEHFISVCCKCHVVLSWPRVTGYTFAGRPVPGDILKVSHGYCPACAQGAHVELDRLFVHCPPVTAQAL